MDTVVHSAVTGRHGAGVLLGSSLTSEPDEQREGRSRRRASFCGALIAQDFRTATAKGPDHQRGEEEQGSAGGVRVDMARREKAQAPMSATTMSRAEMPLGENPFASRSRASGASGIVSGHPAAGARSRRPANRSYSFTGDAGLPRRVVRSGCFIKPMRLRFYRSRRVALFSGIAAGTVIISPRWRPLCF